MNYLNLYRTKIIPKASLSLLYEQKRNFEGQEDHEDKQIYQAICERIEELEVVESIKSAM